MVEIFLFVDSRRQIESHGALRIHVVQHMQRRPRNHKQRHLIRDRLGLRKGHEIFEREHHFRIRRTVDVRPELLRLGRLVLFHQDAGLAPVAHGRALDLTLFHGQGGDIAEGRHVLHDAAELTARQLHRAGVFEIRNLHVLRVDLHQIHGELVAPGSGTTLEFNFQRGLVLALAEQNGVVVLGAFNDLGKNVDIHTKTNRFGARIEGAGVGEKREANEGDVGGVHGLELDAVFRTEPVDVVDEVFDGVQDTLQKDGVGKAGFEHVGCVVVGLLLCSIKFTYDELCGAALQIGVWFFGDRLGICLLLHFRN